MLRALLNINPLILATSLALLALALGLLVRRRVMLVRLQRRRLAEQSAAEGGETSVLPLAHLASAVEVLDLDDLLAGEEGSIAAAARIQLEQPTDVGSAPDTFFPLPTAPAGRPSVAFAAPMATSAAPPRPRAVAANPAHTGGNTGSAAAEPPVPVRELALAWFEARGYRPSNASEAVRPIELVLRHRKDPARAYAFIVERAPVMADRVEALVVHARSIGLTRVLVAAENGFEPGMRQRYRRQGVRLVDQNEMRREFEKLDLRVAAKIMAVARSRARSRKQGS
ncbi:MAG TPA: hypothetical protein VNW98_07380 [Burkholderiaceae bacterium]|jgi:hypothetical protein|nr:hypothetical protein [Burkholderiaceae bacterium]